jgi:hypothetical protein
MTSFLNPSTCISRFRHLGSSSTFASSDALEDGLERPESKDEDSGDDDRGDRWYTLFRPNRRYSEFRFIHVPPKSSVTTTSGSMNAPAPMPEDYQRGTQVDNEVTAKKTACESLK